MWTGFQKFSGGGGEGRGQTKSATVRFFPGSAPEITIVIEGNFITVFKFTLSFSY